MSRQRNDRMTLRAMIARAMQDSEHWAIRMEYRDRKGAVTSRFVSPVRFLAADRFLALCLCREEPRQFYVDRCEDVTLIPAEEILMPMEFHAAV